MTSMLPTVLIVLLVLAALCAILGAVYACIYCTRIDPFAIRRTANYCGLRSGSKPKGGAGGGGGGGGGLAASDDETPAPITSQLPMTSTHVFLFRKS